MPSRFPADHLSRRAFLELVGIGSGIALLSACRKAASGGLTNRELVVGFAALRRAAGNAAVRQRATFRVVGKAKQKSRFAGVDESEIGCMIRPPSIGAAAGEIEGRNTGKTFSKMFSKRC